MTAPGVRRYWVEPHLMHVVTPGEMSTSYTKVVKATDYDALQAKCHEREDEIKGWKDLLSASMTDTEKAQARCEALERERDQWKETFERQCDDVRHLKAERDALAGENEQLRQWRIDVTANLLRPGGAFYDDVPKHVKALAEQAAQLFTCPEMHTIFVEGGRKSDDDIPCPHCTVEALATAQGDSTVL